MLTIDATPMTIPSMVRQLRTGEAASEEAADADVVVSSQLPPPSARPRNLLRRIGHHRPSRIVTIREANPASCSVMRNHDDCASFAVEREQDAQDFLSRDAVERAGRLVGKENAGICDDGPRDRRALLLAAGQHRRKVMNTMAGA